MKVESKLHIIPPVHQASGLIYTYSGTGKEQQELKGGSIQHMWWDLRKGTTLCYSRIFILNAYIPETIAAMHLNFGKDILPSSCYNHKEFWATRISDMGGARSHVDRVGV